VELANASSLSSQSGVGERFLVELAEDVLYELLPQHIGSDDLFPGALPVLAPYEDVSPLGDQLDFIGSGNTP
jgi:hypothetical protein